MAFRRLFLVSLSLAVAGILPANAVTYLNSSAFQTATAGLGLTIEDFGAYSPGTLIPNGSALGGLTYTFNTQAGLGGVITNDYNSISGNSLAGKVVSGALSLSDYFYANEGFTVTFPHPVTAVGIFSNTNLPVAATLATAAGTASTTFTTYDSSTFGFLGFSSPTPFTYATFTSSTFNVPEIAFASAVPEPDVWMMMLVGLFGVGGALRFSRRGNVPITPARQVSRR